MTSLPKSTKEIISFVLGGIVTAVFSLFLFKGMGDFTTLTDIAVVAVYAISLIFGLMGAAVCRCAFFGSVPKFKKNTHFYSIAAFVMTFAAITLAYVILGIYPFGKETALVIDMYHQYSVFFVDLKERLAAGESLLYSMRLGLGGAYTPMFAYYLASPFNIIAMLFPTSYMSEGVALVELLKISAAALSFSFFMRGVFKRNDFSVVLFSMMYALSSYIMAYSWNIMWLDCIIMLPLAALGLNLLVNKGSYTVYCIALGLCLLSNFYIGFMVCIALVLYFLSIVAADGKITLKQFLLRCARFALGSLVGGGLAAILIIPTYKALQLTSSANDVFPTLLQTNFTFADLLSQQFYSVPVGIDFGDLPNIYCGIIIIMLVPLYCLNKTIPLRKKLCELSFAGVMFMSLMLNYTDWIWHGLHYPNGLPYRFAFVYIFAILIIGCRAVTNIDTAGAKNTAISAACAIGLAALLQALGYFEDTVRVVITGIAFLIIYFFIILAVTRKKLAVRSCYALLALVMCFELAANAVYSVGNINDRFYYADRDGYYNDYQAVTGAADELEQLNDTFFRLEHLPSNTCNDNCLYNYNGLTVFSSCNAQRIVNLMDRLGYANNGVNSHMYRCFNPAADSLFGLKYLITQSNINNHPQLEKIGSVDNDGDTLYVYQNNYALPLGYLTNSQLSEWDWDNENPFEVLNEFYELATGVSNVYEILDMDIEAQDNFDCQSYDGRYLTGSPIDFSYNASITASCELPRDGQVYAYCETTYMRTLDVFYDTQSINVSNSEPYVVDLGVMSQGERVAVSIEVNYLTEGAMTCAMLNEENFEKAIEILQSSAFTEQAVNDGYIKGTVNGDKTSLLVLSVPYDEGWSVYIDGKEGYVNALGDALISVVVPSGEHTVELKFKTAGLTAGVIISDISLLILLLLIFKEKLYIKFYKFLPAHLKNAVRSTSGFKVKTPAKETIEFSKEELDMIDELICTYEEENKNGETEEE